MNYTKPEVAVLGQAVHVIEDSHTKGVVYQIDFLSQQHKRTLAPAYDLDE